MLQQLEQEVAKPDSQINRGGGTSKDQLERIATDCEVVLKQVDKMVMAYAAPNEEKEASVRYGREYASAMVRWQTWEILDPN